LPGVPSTLFQVDVFRCPRNEVRHSVGIARADAEGLFDVTPVNPKEHQVRHFLPERFAQFGVPDFLKIDPQDGVGVLGNGSPTGNPRSTDRVQQRLGDQTPGEPHGQDGGEDSAPNRKPPFPMRQVHRRTLDG
jgi:hypothetical protein